MAIETRFKPIAKAIMENVEEKNPDAVIFVVGRRIYKAKDIKRHFESGDKVAKKIIKMALQTQTKEVNTLSPNEINEELIQKTAQMFR